MNAVATAVAAPKLSPVEAYKLQILPPERAAELHRALPAHIRPERFERNLLNALMQNPKLMEHDPRLVYREVSKAAGLGLVLDPQLGEAYIIEAWDGRMKKAVPQLRVGYRGIMKLAKQSGEIATIYAHAVHERDHIICELGDKPKLEHRPELFADRGAVVGYYAVVRYKDGETDFEPMNRAEVEAIRGRSDAYKAFQAGKIKSTPWTTDFSEMARKTVIRRLLKRVPQSPDLADVLTDEERAARQPPMRTVSPAPSGEPMLPSSKLDALEGPSADVEVPAESFDDGYDPETGEVVEVVAEAAEAPAPAPVIKNAVLESLIADIKDATTLETVDFVLQSGDGSIDHMNAPDRKRLESVVALRRRELGGKR